MIDPDILCADAEQVCGEIADDIDRYPRRSQISVDVAWQNILGLDGFQGFDVPLDASPARCIELAAHIAGEIIVPRDRLVGLRVAENKIA